MQHAPVPEATVKAPYAYVRPGGWLVFDHDAVSRSSAVWLGVHVARQLFKRMQVERRLPSLERTG